jgi:uncharacterized protein
MARMGGHGNPRYPSGWRLLGLFWLMVLTVLATGSGVLTYLGPPVKKPPEASLPPVPTAIGEGKVVLAIAASRPVAPDVSGQHTPGSVVDPDAALLEPAKVGSTDNLPRIGPDGRTAMRIYAAGFDHGSRLPRVGLLLAGIGPNEAESDAAIRSLPGAVSLAVSPYAANVTKLLATARTTGHEYLIEVPLEPTGFPLNDPGPSTLLTSLPPAANVENLHWALSRIAGYVGATGVIGTMRGERLAAMTDQMDAVLADLAERGLLYVDPREGRGAVTKAWGRQADLMVDDPADQAVADRTMIDAKLAELEQRAKDNGSALGLVMQPTPVTVARVAAWSNGLADRGLTLTPVSALALPPTDVPVKLSEREH